ncbi:hypothetical protein M2306_003357 [Myroides gitamensis]|uniref:Uncharacterized protein n=1 Tax=Myroides odoratus TaxID=256 RepID=A0A378U3N2_MYROD|nr:hypothetical protein [Myroides odoratus]MCS4238896.1 hypothetical protein [Myroides odoratus]MDH6602663.1 hypothetical protein [Myroides gitamensis]QQU03778.1 hypothetical protein I6I89_00240 [Myroides odoratus]STZ68942.1 Uncharacterised protein [Myroides odoratus]
MRNILAPLFLLFSFVLSAQNSAQSNLNVILKPIQSIKINDQQQHVNLSFETVEDYTKGKISNQADHIEVMSSGTYEIRVVAQAPLMHDADEIRVEHIGLNPSLGGIGDFRDNITLLPVSLSMRERNMIQSNAGDVKRTFNVSYKMNASDELLNKPVGTYSTVITYTILSL